MAKKPLPAPVVDLSREMALLKATQAPVIFFEIASTFGVRNGVCNITLDGGMHLNHNGQTIAENRTVAHLRFPVSAIPTLREALDHIEESLKPVPEGLKN
jgi:hypothetical protein